MKRILVIIFTIASVCVSAQIYDPVNWDFTQHQISETEIELQFTAHIEKHWHLYSQHIDDNGPVPTEFTFTTSVGYNLIDGVNEGESLEEFDPNFDMVLKYFGDDITYKMTKGDDINIEFNGSLREHQDKIVKLYLDTCNEDKFSSEYSNGGLISIQCGGGKTVIALNIITQLKKKTLVVVHKTFLMDQWN